MESRSNFWQRPKGRVVAGPVRPTFHGEVEFSFGIWAAVSNAALGVGIADDLAVAVAEAEGVGVVEGEADGEVVGSSVTVSVATGLFGAFAFAGSSSPGDGATGADAHHCGHGERSDDRAVSGDWPRGWPMVTEY